MIPEARCAFAFFFASGACFAQSAKEVVRIQSAEAALEHVRVIDGTGARTKSDQTIVISAGKIAAVGNSRSMKIPSTNIKDIENVEIVFKDGIGYDTKELIASINGLVGIRSVSSPL